MDVLVSAARLRGLGRACPTSVRAETARSKAAGLLGTMRVFVLMALALASTAASSAASTGQVTHVLDGAPIADVRVVLLNRITHAVVAETHTGPDGRYTFDDRPSGTYLSASLEPYLSYSGYEAPFSAVDIALSLPAYYEGTVRDAASGNAIQGLLVRIFRPGGSSLQHGLTDATGSFRVGPVPQGSYLVCIFHAADELRDECFDDQHVAQSELSLAMPTFIASGQVLAGVDLGLDPTSTISGRLFDRSTAAPIVNGTVPISFYSAQGRQISSRSVTTDASGNYVRTGVEPRASLVVAGDERYSTRLYDDVDCSSRFECPWAQGTSIDVPEGGHVGDIDFSLVPGAIIRGRVTDAASGVGLADVPIRLAEFGLFGPVAVAESVSGPDGEYEFRHLRAGSSYWLYTNARRGYLNERWTGEYCAGQGCTSGAMIPLARDEVRAGVDFALAPGGSIRGEAHAGGESVGLRGVITLYTSSGGIAWSGPTDADGRYESAALPPGMYRAGAEYLARPRLCVMFGGSACVFSGTSVILDGALPIELGAVTIDGVDFGFPYALILRNDFE